jgi:hypothetical protein
MMKNICVLLVAVMVLSLGASAVQAQCCGGVVYTGYYGGASCSGGGCSAGGCSSCAAPACGSCGSCSSCYAPYYTSYYTPYYTYAYSPYYTVGYASTPYSVGYGGWGRSCCGWW